MVALMRRDNVADPSLPGLQDLGIDAVGLTTVLDNPSGIRPKAISRNLR
jgi:hypothetical protein